tara:strand:- start:887 stop:1090 length:204 start_codon:yes stop_codon:yes gene_type:complete
MFSDATWKVGDIHASFIVHSGILEKLKRTNVALFSIYKTFSLYFSTFTTLVYQLVGQDDWGDLKYNS